jgi:spore germination protein GerM
MAPGRAARRPRRTVRQGIVLVVVVLVGALIGGCGVPAAGHTRVLSTADVPYHLLRPQQTGAATTQPTEAPRGDVRGLIAFTDQDGTIRLVARWVQAGRPAAVVQALLQQLALGPSPAEQRRGLQSTVVAGGNLTVVSVTGGVALVSLPGELHDQGADQLSLGVAQIVFSSTSAPQVTAVLLESDGRRIDAPTGNGSLVSTPLTRQDYPSLLTMAP